jgi:hypothetical protein
MYRLPLANVLVEELEINDQHCSTVSGGCRQGDLIECDKCIVLCMRAPYALIPFWYRLGILREPNVSFSLRKKIR